MDPPYLYKLSQGTSLFRAKTIAKEGRWYALSLDDAYTYGSYATEYSTVKDLRLINIMSLTFQNDFMDRLTILYPGSDYSGMDRRRISCLITLGLFDIESQQTASNVMHIPISYNDDMWKDPLLQLNTSYMHHRNRYSEHGMDTHFVSVLEQIYGDIYDGYISPIQWATKIHGGYFPRELCIFKLGNTREEKEHSHSTPIQVSVAESSAGSRGGKDDLLKYDISPDIWDAHNKLIKAHPFKPLWNPHTEDTIPSTGVSISSKKRNTRKNKKNSRIQTIL